MDFNPQCLLLGDFILALLRSLFKVFFLVLLFWVIFQWFYSGFYSDFIWLLWCFLLCCFTGVYFVILGLMN